MNGFTQKLRLPNATDRRNQLRSMVGIYNKICINIRQSKSVMPNCFTLKLLQQFVSKAAYWPTDRQKLAKNSLNGTSLYLMS